MDSRFLIVIFCPDRHGLIAAITGRLFEIGMNLNETRFVVLGAGAELTTVAETANALSVEELREQLKSLPELGEEAEILVMPFRLSPQQGSDARITHRISIHGGDHPGLIARLSEVFGDYQGNIVRLYAERVPCDPIPDYRIEIDAHLPADRAAAALAAVNNTASALQLESQWHEVVSGAA